MSFLKNSLIVVLGMLTLTAAELVLFGNNGMSVVAEASSGEATVSTISQFETALKDASINSIVLKNSISFTKNITGIPNRDVVINGSDDNGVVIISGPYGIQAKTNYSGTNNFTIKNAEIVGHSTSGRFFEATDGWNVLVEDVIYDGVRFVNVSNGNLTFSGENRITTLYENATARHLKFEADSTYTGLAATKNNYQSPAFDFNGKSVSGKAVGTIIVGKKANVNIGVGLNTNNYSRPAFQGKVTQIDVEEDAKLNIDAAGVAFQFASRTDYATINPIFTIGEKSKVSINGQGAGNQAAMKLQSSNTSININPRGSLVVTGNSTKAVIESARGTQFNLLQAENFEIKNRKIGSKLFYSLNTSIKGVAMQNIEVWSQTGGDYLENSMGVFQAENYFVSFGKVYDSQMISVTGDLSQQFRPEIYGKISLKGGSF
ncbi:pectate lyase-like adhesive domain-containing protein [Enterococcus sp. LJL128]|uniref:pectate lyase-like adhesive domain-containing protein n=1 Tax=Enterococcus sp. LJL51 TaxID=3416656 RepID=UPI003CE99872